MRRDRADRLDEADELAGFRQRFALPDSAIYLDGNSLGAMPVDTPAAVRTVLDEWRSDAVRGWDRWIDISTSIGDRLAPLIGAPPGTVAVADQTSINLFKLASAALRYTGRPSILTDAGNFPSDRYVLEGVATAAGGRLVVAPEDADPVILTDHLSGDVGLIALTHVAYGSGRMHDGPAVTHIAHDHGALMLWDLAHTAGAVPVDLERWQADLAVGCTYKYLNGGPGSPGFLYVGRQLQTQLRQPIQGWFGHVDMFAFAADYEPSPSIRRFLVGTPPVVALAATAAGIEVTAEAGIDRIRAKGMSLTRLFCDLVVPVLARHGGEVAGPVRSEHRGSHVSVRHHDAYALSLALRDAGVVVDFRGPDLIRFGFSPLYLRHRDVTDAVDCLGRILDEGRHHGFASEPRGVT